MTRIQGDRVLLRPLCESDLEESLRVWTPELRHMYGGSLVDERRPTIDDRRRWFERVQRGEEGHCYAIEADGRYIGYVNIKIKDEANQRASLGIGIDNPSYWGRGYGTEVVRLMLRHAFETLDLHRVSLRVAAYNTRAIRCYEKAGFRHEGVERDSFFVDGKWHDDVLMAVLREEWEAQPNPSPLKGEALPDGLSLRSYRDADYEQVAALWAAMGWVDRPRDRREALAYKVTHDAGPFLVAESEGRIIGTAMGTWDGRWAWINRVAVEPAHRRRGIGRRLMREVEARLAAVRAQRAGLLTGADGDARMFSEGLGYCVREGILFMSKELVGKGTASTDTHG